MVNLNEEQLNIVNAPLEDNLLLVACAGSGKTTTLIHRIKFLIDSGIEPSKIILTTFNVDASQSMKNRLKILYENETPPDIKIGTFDAIARGFYYKYFKSEKKEENILSVSEYGIKFLEFLNTPEGGRITSDYKYFFFDEFQDCNDIQFNVIKKFYEAGVIITVIGDDAQNIYQWRGSNIEYILNFNKYIPNSKLYKLVQNYRSTPEIVAFANNSIKNNTDQIPKEMISNKPSVGFKPIINKYWDDATLCNALINKIISYKQKGISYGEIVIMCRNNGALKKVEEYLEKYKKIPYVALITESNNSSNKPSILDDHITLTTIHKSKGLEWDVVFLIGCDDFLFPSELDNISIQAERRLFYVAVTRAKRYLHISFTGFTITRFVVELDPKLYIFQDFKDRFIKNNNNRFIAIREKLNEVIDMVPPNKLDMIRKNYLPSLSSCLSNQVHGVCDYNENIDKLGIANDYGTFISRYTNRHIARKHPESNGFRDFCAESILSSYELSSDEFTFYTKFQQNFQTQLKLITKDTPVTEYYDILDDGLVKKGWDASQAVPIAIQLVDVAKSINKRPEEIQVYPDNYISGSFKDELLQANKKYKNNKKSNKNIMREIYLVSICQNILEGRRRLLYKDVFSEFTKDNVVLKNIRNFINTLKDKELFCVSNINDKDYEIITNIDLYNKTDNEVIMYKVSRNQDIQFEWLLELFANCALLENTKQFKDNNKKIEKASIYNPLKGSYTTYDISNWTTGKEFLDYLTKIRDSKIKE